MNPCFSTHFNVAFLTHPPMKSSVFQSLRQAQKQSNSYKTANFHDCKRQKPRNKHKLVIILVVESITSSTVRHFQTISTSESAPIRL